MYIKKKKGKLSSDYTVQFKGRGNSRLKTESYGVKA